MIMRYDEIGWNIKEIIKGKKIEIPEFAERHYKELGYNNSASARNYISTVVAGHIYGLNVQDIKIGSRRLSKLLYLLGFEVDNSIIQKLKESNKEFVYPPKEDVKDDLPQQVIKAHKKEDNPTLEQMIEMLDQEDRKKVVDFVDELYRKKKC